MGVRHHLYVTGDVGGDLALTVAGPTGSAGRYGAIGAWTGMGAGVSGDAVFDSKALGGVDEFGVRGTAPVVTILIKGIVVNAWNRW